jgi:2-oxoglutarate dehydrogenase complex dehydrogenase (E1) component-like enzyme
MTWIQEESLNAGAFAYAKAHLQTAARRVGRNDTNVSYIGRKSVHSICSGNSKDHKLEVEELFKKFEKALN